MPIGRPSGDDSLIQMERPELRGLHRLVKESFDRTTAVLLLLLLNVVRGEMSLLGPRPPRPSEVERHGVEIHRRPVVEPGLTGRWQVRRPVVPVVDRLGAAGFYYVDNWSLGLT